jgi:hypothetical protein
MRRAYRPLNDCEMQRNAGVGLFARPLYFALQGVLFLSDDTNSYDISIQFLNT